MLVSFNCSVLSDMFNLLDTFSVNINKENNENIIAKLGNNHYGFEDFKVDHFKDYICDRKKVADSDRHAVKLWKVDVDMEMINEISTRKELLKDEMISQRLFYRYFKINRENHDPEKTHIIAIIPTTGKCLLTFYLSNKKFVIYFINLFLYF
jgi:hypothetical protein